MQGAQAGLHGQMHRRNAPGSRGAAGRAEASRAGASAAALASAGPAPRPGIGQAGRSAAGGLSGQAPHAGYFASLPYSGGYTTGPFTSPEGEDGTGPPADGLDGVAGLTGVTPASCRAVLPSGTGAVPAAAGTGLVPSCTPPKEPAVASAGTGWEEACTEGVFEASPPGAAMEGWRAGAGEGALPGRLRTAGGWRAERGADKASASFPSGEAEPSEASWRTTGMVPAASGLSDGTPDACAFSCAAGRPLDFPAGPPALFFGAFPPAADSGGTAEGDGGCTEAPFEALRRTAMPAEMPPSVTIRTGAGVAFSPFACGVSSLAPSGFSCEGCLPGATARSASSSARDEAPPGREAGAPAAAPGAGLAAESLLPVPAAGCWGPGCTRKGRSSISLAPGTSWPGTKS